MYHFDKDIFLCDKNHRIQFHKWILLDFLQNKNQIKHLIISRNLRIDPLLKIFSGGTGNGKTTSATKSPPACLLLNTFSSWWTGSNASSTTMSSFRYHLLNPGRVILCEEFRESSPDCTECLCMSTTRISEGYRRSLARHRWFYILIKLIDKIAIIDSQGWWRLTLFLRWIIAINTSGSSSTRTLSSLNPNLSLSPILRHAFAGSFTLQLTNQLSIFIENAKIIQITFLQDLFPARHRNHIKALYLDTKRAKFRLLDFFNLQIAKSAFQAILMFKNLFC